MSTQTRELRKSQQSFAGTDRSSTSIASLEKIANRSSQGQSVQRHSTIRSDGSANPPLSKTLRRVPVRLPRWMSMLQICQCASAAVIIGAGVTSLAIGGRAWVCYFFFPGHPVVLQGPIVDRFTDANNHSCNRLSSHSQP